MARPGLIAVDWGTTSFRAYLVAGDGTIAARQATGDGILSVQDGAFSPVLARATASWRREHGELPILMSGMIGSRQGWREAAYLSCPATADELASKLLRFSDPVLGELAIVPGLICHPHGKPDVMRGEETQIIGALQRLGAKSHTFVLPGTHAKWVSVTAGSIGAFRTYMTGEVFAALKGHTILGRTMSRDAKHVPEAFGRGVEFGAARGAVGDLLNRIFSARTLGLTGELAADDAASYLSGLLIGAEIASAAPIDPAFVIIAGEGLAARYLEAAALLGLKATSAPPDCAVPGLLAIARAAGLVGAAP